MRDYRKIASALGSVTLALIIGVCTLVTPKAYSFDSYEDQILYESLRAQGYSRQVATDEVWERKGQPDVYGTGGVDGISTYGTSSFGGLNSSSNSSSSSSKHTHVWGEAKTTKEPSCDEFGEAVETCSCGETRTIQLPKLEHTYKIDAFPASCKDYRKDVYTCTCGDTYTIEFPEEGYADHIYIPTEDSVDADCIHDGLIKYVCASCGDPKEEVVEALGHEFTKYTVDIEPWCTTPGVKSIHCDRCDEEQENSKVAIEPLGHVEKAEHEIVPATFWKNGMETVYCDRCDEKLREEVLPATGGVFRYVIPVGGGAGLVGVITLILRKRKEKGENK